MSTIFIPILIACFTFLFGACMGYISGKISWDLFHVAWNGVGVGLIYGFGLPLLGFAVGAFVKYLKIMLF